MKKLSALVLLCFLPLVSVIGQSKKVSERDLPVAVVRSLERNYPGYTVSQVVRLDQRGIDNGFRVRVQKRGGTWDVELDTRGRVRERVVVIDHRHDDDHHDHKHKKKDKHKHKREHHCREHHCGEHHHHYAYDDDDD